MTSLKNVVMPMMQRKINVSPGFLYAALRGYKDNESTRGGDPCFLEITVFIPRGSFKGEFDNDEDFE